MFMFIQNPKSDSDFYEQLGNLDSNTEFKQFVQHPPTPFLNSIIIMVTFWYFSASQMQISPASDFLFWQ